MFVVGRKHTYGKAPSFYFREEGISVVPDDILFVFIQIQGFFKPFTTLSINWNFY